MMYGTELEQNLLVRRNILTRTNPAKAATLDVSREGVNLNQSEEAV
jgi:hypothetical protein